VDPDAVGAIQPARQRPERAAAERCQRQLPPDASHAQQAGLPMERFVTFEESRSGQQRQAVKARMQQRQE
jgi:hypothetical protein